MLLLVTQHNEYKTLFGSAIFWLQYAVFGKINFALSSAIGDFMCVGVAPILWKLFLPRLERNGLRLALFLPVALLMFQLNYAESLNAPMTALQHLPAIICACSAIYLLVRGGEARFYLAALCLILGIFSSTNEFLVFPIGLVILALHRRYAHLAIWTALTLAALLVYRYHYVSSATEPPAMTGSFLKTLLILKPLYTLGVLGAAAAPFGGSAPTSSASFSSRSMPCSLSEATSRATPRSAIARYSCS